MSEITDLLFTQARNLEKQASALENTWGDIKKSTVEALSTQGVDQADAEGLLEKLAERAYPNRDQDLEKAQELKHFATIFEKTAGYIADLEVKLDNREADLSNMEKAAEDAVKAPSVEALSDTGVFSGEDLNALSMLDDSTLQKVAYQVNNTPMNMGGPSDRLATGVDSFTEFLLS